MNSKNNVPPNYLTSYRDSSPANNAKDERALNGNKGAFPLQSEFESSNASDNVDSNPEDNDSNSSTRTLGSSRDSATLTSSDVEESNSKERANRSKGRPFSESISGDEFNPIRLRSVPHLHQLRDHRSSADIYLMEDAAKNIPRYTPSSSPKQFGPNTQQSPNGNPYFTDPLASIYPGAYAGHMHVGEKSMPNLGNYQMMQQNAFQRASHSNLCRLGCDHCLPTYMPYHSSLMYDPHLLLNNAPCWDCSSSSVPNPMLTNFVTHPFYASQAHLGQMASRKTLGNNGNSQVSSAAEDKLHQQQALLEKSSISTADYYSPELADTLTEQDRNSNYLQQLAQTNESQFHENSQGERIAQLESIVSILRNQLLNTEDLFKKALLSKKALEGANCDLLTVVDKLKLDLTHSEGRRKLIEEHNVRLEVDLESLKTRLLEKETEVSSLRLTMAKIVRSTGYVLSDNELALLRGKTIASDFIKNKLIKDAYAEAACKPPISKGNAFYSEPSSRRESFSSTLCGRSSPVPVRFHSAHPSPSSTPPTRTNQPSKYAYETVPNSGMLRSTSAENMKMNSEHISETGDNSLEHRARSEDKQTSKYNKNMYSTLPHNSRALRQIQRQLEESERQSDLDKRPGYANDEMRLMSQSLLDEQLNSKAFSTPSSPVTTFKSSMHTTTPVQTNTGAVTFGKTFFWLRRNKRATSAPELAKDDEIIPPSLQSSTSELSRNGIAPPRIIINDSKPKGFKKIFSRKRSTSSLAGLSDAFSRGGLRATSGPRLGFNNVEKKFLNIDLPFSQWDTTLVADWFAVIGLGMYVAECKRWCKSGEHLMRATSAEVEKDLGIRNMLHRKKLRLAVAAMNDEEDQLLKNAGKLDYLWVARWLDDIGLPQYKDAFLDARIDGRVLHYLTVEDLFYLKVTSQLHFASIRAGIKILRENKYNSQCLKRRAAPEEAHENEWQATEVALWSSHRVMEWLRSIDLSEYAPNLRGSGVHGALILHENAFNADLFATLLSIPTSKTLLRRHISAKFKQLIGDELNKVKRDFECQPNYSPMIPGSKVKAYKKGHFTLMRKKRSDYELTDYVCPMSPVVSTRTKIINMIQDSKGAATKNEQLSSLSSLRENSASTKSLQSEPAKNETSDCSGNSGSNSFNGAQSNDFTARSDSELEEQPTKKESVIS